MATMAPFVPMEPMSNDDPFETMVIHWSYNGSNGENSFNDDNGFNDDIGSNGDNGDIT